MNRKTAGIGLVLAAIMTVGAGSSLAAPRTGEQRRVQGEAHVNNKNLRAVNIDVVVGKIHVIADSPSGIRWRAVRVLKGNPANHRRWLEETSVRFDQQDRTLMIKDVITYEDRNEKNSNPSVQLEVEVHVPRGFDVESKLAMETTIIEGQIGEVKAETGMGDVNLRRVRSVGEGMHIEVSMGDANLDLVKLPEVRCKVHVGMGEARINLPSNIRAGVHLSVGMGSVRSDFDLQSPRRGKAKDPKTLSGELNGGGASLEVHTGMGEISLEKELKIAPTEHTKFLLHDSPRVRH